MSELEPITREEEYYDAMINDGEIPAPITRQEQYLAALAGKIDDMGDLPEVTQDDDGKVAGVVDGEWGAVNIPDGNLPPVSASDDGKLLGVDNGEWGVVLNPLASVLVDEGDPWGE